MLKRPQKVFLGKRRVRVRVRLRVRVRVRVRVRMRVRVRVRVVGECECECEGEGEGASDIHFVSCLFCSLFVLSLPWSFLVMAYSTKAGASDPCLGPCLGLCLGPCLCLIFG